MLPLFKRAGPPIADEISGVGLSFYTAEEIRKLSVKQITNPQSFLMKPSSSQETNESALHSPIPCGCHDLALGPNSRSCRCGTCGLDYSSCPGHMGHIELPIPVFNPVLFRHTFQILQQFCFNCFRLRVPESDLAIYETMYKLLERDEVAKATELFDYLSTQSSNRSAAQQIADIMKPTPTYNILGGPRVVANPSRVTTSLRQRLFLNIAAQAKDSAKCPHCRAPRVKLRYTEGRLFVLRPSKINIDANHTFNSPTMEDFADWVTGKSGTSAFRLLAPFEARGYFRLLWEKDQTILNFMYSGLAAGSGKLFRVSRYQDFFIDALPVSPNTFRPASISKGQMTCHASTWYYQRILKICQAILTHKPDPKKPLDVVSAERSLELQKTIDAYFMNPGGQTTQPGTKGTPRGIKQVLEKKEGLFRKNMMGKRVDFIARSVISPDPFIDTCEIGVPLVFAKKLTFTENVTDHNIEWLRKLVINGPTQYPGANYIVTAGGQTVVLGGRSLDQRVAFAKLLRPADKTPGLGDLSSSGVKVLRHLMDGDYLLVNRQPSLHKPSMMGHKARILGSERTIHMHYANCNSYNADFDGDEMNLHFPQSHVTRAELQYICSNENQYLVPKDGTPLRGLIQDHIVSGVYLTCKDTFFTREKFQQLLYLACFRTNKGVPIKTPIPAILKPVPLWTGKQLVSALLDVLLAGKAPFNLTSTEQIPGSAWGKGQEEGVVIFRGNQLVQGILGKKQFGTKPHGLVHAVNELYGPDYSGQLLSTLGRLLTGYLQVKGFTCGVDDLMIDNNSEKARRNLLAETEKLGFVEAAKFTKLIDEKDTSKPDDPTIVRNRPQIIRALRELVASPQEAVNWDNVMISCVSKSTTAIIDACVGLEKPFPKNNFIMMTSSGAKGSRVNFSQVSCLLGQQELEGRRVPVMATGKTLPCFAPYDPSPRAGGYIGGRFLTGIEPQEFYFHCMAGREGLIDTAVKTSRSGYLQRNLIKHMEGLIVGYDNTVRDSDGSVIQFNYGEDSVEVVRTGWLNNFEFLHDNKNALDMTFKPNERRDILGTISEKEKKKAGGDPLMGHYFPNYKLGVVSEQFSNKLQEFIQTAKLSTKEAARFTELMHFKYMNSLVTPGENVGILAAQSIGEPSTQMTLNTFHLAGRGDVNVTLGIPRLKELLMHGCGNIAVPEMLIPLQDKYNSEAAAKKVQELFNPIVLDELVLSVSIEESLQYLKKSLLKTFRVSIELTQERVPSHVRFELHRLIKTEFVPTFLEQVQQMVSATGGQIKTRGKRRKKPVDEEEDEADGEDVAADEDDFADDEGKKGKAKRQKKKTADEAKDNRKASQFGYSDDEDQDEEDGDADEVGTDAEDADDVDDEEPDSTEKKKKGKKKKSMDLDDLEAEEDDEEEESPKKKKTKKKKGKTLPPKATISCQQFKLEPHEDGNPDHFLVQFMFHLPSSARKVLFMTQLRAVLQSFKLNVLPNIQKAFVHRRTKPDTRYCIRTVGINHDLAVKHREFFKIDELYTNDPSKYLQVYGVEAARASLIEELNAVFKAYGIDVNWRHLYLIADFMTFAGKITAYDRRGLRDNTSPFLKMSYESCFDYLSKTVSSGEYDSMSSPASSIVFGTPARVGTGAFQVRYDLSDSTIPINKKEITTKVVEKVVPKDHKRKGKVKDGRKGNK